MVKDEVGLKLHNRLTRGEQLSIQEQAQLEVWYAAQAHAEAWLLADEIPEIESLSDKQVLSLCELQMAEDEQEALSRLLVANRESTLDDAGRAELEQLMRLYHHGLLRKAQALKEAIKRGLKSPLH